MRPVTLRVAKSVFALADVFAGRWPGPRLLIYHQVGVDVGREMEVAEDTFRRQLEWVLANGMAVDLETALSRRGGDDADRLYSLGFDDGYRDLYDVAFPILKQHAVPFTLYLTTAPAETGKPRCSVLR